MKEMCDNFVSGTNGVTYPLRMNMAEEIEEKNCLESFPLMQAYIPLQPYTTPMSKEQSLICGTVFSDLLDPYCQGFHLRGTRKEG